MTNSNGAKKFEKAFSDAGITNYEIKAGITGEEKVEFIGSSSVFFMPSLRENYPFAFLEMSRSYAMCSIRYSRLVR
jgi:hypothetical protein